MMIRLGALLAALLLPQASEVKEVRDLQYCGEEGCAERKHRLDLFLPQGKEKAPVVMWIHGGAWKLGDKAMFAGLGRRFAEDGVGMAAINYRLTPQVKHPEHVKDCARAFAWLLANVAAHGGNPDRLFVMGQSAGGHLSSLLALDRRYLDDLKVPAGAIKGAIPMSGVYEIPALEKARAGLLGVFPDVFGSDPDACRQASPLTHVKNSSAPMLVVTEAKDTFAVRASMGLFRAAFAREGVKGVEFVDAEDRDHISIVVRMFGKEDPVRARILEFVRSRCKELDGAK